MRFTFQTRPLLVFSNSCNDICTISALLVLWFVPAKTYELNAFCLSVYVCLSSVKNLCTLSAFV